MSAIHLFDGNNVMLRDLDSATHQRLGLRQRWEQANQPGVLHIWVWDGRGHNRRRKEVYPEYKANRTPMAEDRFAQIHVFREALEHSNAWQVECDGWEGDDVIASLVRRFSAKGGIPITIHTNDLDYAQLRSLPLVHLNGVKPCPCPPHRLALYKAMVGDPSDNIKGIPGFGPKAWEALESYWADIEAYVDVMDEAGLKSIPFKPAHRAWVCDPPNLMKLRAMLAITRFFDVPDEDLNAGIKKGVHNFEKMDALFRRFFL